MAELTENVLLAVLAEADLLVTALFDLHNELLKCLLKLLLALLLGICINNICNFGPRLLYILHLGVFLGLLLLLHWTFKFKVYKL